MKCKTLLQSGVTISDEDYRSTIISSLPCYLTSFASAQLTSAQMARRTMATLSMISWTMPMPAETLQLMQEIDPVLIKNSLDDRVAYLTDFVNFTSHDSDVITAIAPHVNAVIPSMVDDLYSKLFEFDITKKVFMTRNHVSYVLRSPPYHHL